MKTLFDSPIIDRPHPVGIGFQKIYRFKNDYGASVVRFSMSDFGFALPRIYGSYTNNEDEYELAVIHFIGKDSERFNITYDTPITDDVLGHLSKDEVEDTLKTIKALPHIAIKENK